VVYQMKIEAGKLEISGDLEECVEACVDSSSLAQVVAHLAEICKLKAGHVDANWGDFGLADMWRRDAIRLDGIAARIENK